MDAKLLHQGGAGFVEAEDFHLIALAAEFEDHFVQGGDGSEIPAVGVGDVDAIHMPGII